MTTIALAAASAVERHAEAQARRDTFLAERVRLTRELAAARDAQARRVADGADDTDRATGRATITRLEAELSEVESALPLVAAQLAELAPQARDERHAVAEADAEAVAAEYCVQAADLFEDFHRWAVQELLPAQRALAATWQRGEAAERARLEILRRGAASGYPAGVSPFGSRRDVRPLADVSADRQRHFWMVLQAVATWAEGEATRRTTDATPPRAA